MKSVIFLQLLLSFVFCPTDTTTKDANSFKTVLNNTEMSFSIEGSEYENFIESTEYDFDEQNFEVNSRKKIEFLQLFDNMGSLQFQLPLGTKSVHLKIGDLDKGHYQVIFTFVGQKKCISLLNIK